MRTVEFLFLGDALTLSLEAGDSSKPSAGLPRSALPFAGAARSEPRASAPAGAGQAGREAVEMFGLLVLTRAAEARLVALADEGRIRQAPRRPALREAGPVASALALRRTSDGSGDVFAPTFRAAGALRLFGVDLDAFFRAHLEGRVGPARGSDAELHHVDLERGLMAPVVPLGLLVEVVGGLTLGARMLGGDRVGLVCDTEGATSTGAWHEGLVVAAARNSPMVLVVETTDDRDAARKHTRVGSHTEKAAGYGVGAEEVDGSDALAALAAARRAVERARTGEGVQMLAVRYGARDPVDVLRDRIEAEHSGAGPELDAIEAEARTACREAVERVTLGGLTGAPDTLDPVYAGGDRIPRRIWVGPVSTEVV